MLSKKQTYLVLAIFLWAVVFDIVYDIVAVSYWNVVATAGPKGAVAGSILFEGSGGEILFIVLGILAGYRAGEGGWKYIYVEDRRHKKYKLDW